MRRVTPESSLTAAHRPAATSPINAMNSPHFIDHLVRQKERSFTLLLVHRIIPRAIEFFLDHPPDIPPA
jgi:hypothetical protein